MVARYKKLQQELASAKKSVQGTPDATGGNERPKTTDGDNRDETVKKLQAEKQQAIDKLKEVVQKYK